MSVKSRIGYVKGDPGPKIVDIIEKSHIGTEHIFTAVFDDQSTLDLPPIYDGDMSKDEFVNPGGTGEVLKAKMVGEAKTDVLEGLTEDEDGKLLYKGNPIISDSEDLFTGTVVEYEVAEAEGKLKDGTLVALEDDEEEEPSYVNPDDFDLTNGILSLSQEVKDNIEQVSEKLSESADWLKRRNSFDGQWSQGYDNGDGTIVENNKYVCGANFIDVGDKTRVSIIYGEVPRIAELYCYTSGMTLIQNIKHNKKQEFHTDLPAGTKYIRVDYSNIGENVTPATATSLEIYVGGLSKSNVEMTTKLSESEDYLKSKNLLDYYSLLKGAYDSTDGHFDSSLAAIATPKINVKPNTSYYLSNVGRVRILFWDSNDNLLSNFILETKGVVNTPNLAMKLAIQGGDGVIKSNSQLELGSTATPYVPYAESNVELTTKISDNAEYLKSKNLLDIKNANINNNSWHLLIDCDLKANHTYFIRIFGTISYNINLSAESINQSISNGSYAIYTPSADKSSITIGTTNVSLVGKENEVRNMQIMVAESNVPISEYEPYYKSNKQLTEEIAKTPKCKTITKTVTFENSDTIAFKYFCGVNNISQSKVLGFMAIITDGNIYVLPKYFHNSDELDLTDISGTKRTSTNTVRITVLLSE